MADKRKKKWTQWSLSQKLGLSITVSLCFAMLCYIVLIFIQSNLNQREDFWIDLLGEVKTKSQKLPYFAEKVAQGNSNYKIDLEVTTKSLDNIIVNMDSVKIIKAFGKSIKLKPLKTLPDNEVFNYKMAWENYHNKIIDFINQPKLIPNPKSDTLQRVPNPQISELNNFINTASISLEEDTSLLIGRIKDIKTSNRFYVVTLVVLLACLNIIFMLFLLFIFNIRVIKRLNALLGFTQSVLEGDKIEARKLTKSNDEIGQIAQITQNIGEDIKQAKVFAKSIGEGNYKASLKIQPSRQKDKNSLISSLVGMQTQLNKLTKEDDKRNWITKGMAEFTEILRSNDTDLHQLSNKVITGIVRYLNAHQGALFILNEDEGEDLALELSACYAYDENIFEEKKLIVQEDFGEGLVGQAFLENDIIYLSNIPTEYISIASGLGETKPRSVLIVPLELNGKVEGVIELASLNTLQDYEIEFVQKIAENIASAILTIKINDHTKKLLHASQELTKKLQSSEEELRQSYDELKQAQEEVEKQNALIDTQKQDIEKALEATTEKNEMLQAQEEEMRQNMEELVATQERMMITQAELDGQLNAINSSTIIKVEFDLNREVINANQAFCNLVNYTLEEAKGEVHQSFAPKESKNELNNIWDTLLTGEVYTGEVKRLTKHKKEIWLNAVYSPVKNRKGDIYKVIKLAFDVTEAKQLFLKTQEQTEILKAQETELRESMSELEKAQDEINKKNQAIIEFKEEEAKNAQLKAKEIESKNQLITSSIQYAQNIQNAILPSETKIKECVQDFFVIYKPKDIVSGDFYWFSHIENKIFFAAVDCTGHGVPGAFMSIIGNTLLNEIVNVQRIFNTGKILELLHIGVRARLKQEETSNHDGMDLAICMLETQKNGKVKLQFSGAKRPLYYIKEEKILELESQRKSIGGWQKEDFRTFDAEDVLLDKGSLVYLFTDGIVDNPNLKRKKFGVKRVRSFIQENYKRPLHKQKETLDHAIIEHQQEAEQRDDITFMCIKI